MIPVHHNYFKPGKEYLIGITNSISVLQRPPWTLAKEDEYIAKYIKSVKIKNPDDVYKVTYIFDIQPLNNMTDEMFERISSINDTSIWFDHERLGNNNNNEIKDTKLTLSNETQRVIISPRYLYTYRYLDDEELFDKIKELREEGKLFKYPTGKKDEEEYNSDTETVIVYEYNPELHKKFQTNIDKRINELIQTEDIAGLVKENLNDHPLRKIYATESTKINQKKKKSQKGNKGGKSKKNRKQKNKTPKKQ